jgi:hypothetical protein
MQALPATDLRQNVLTLAIPTEQLPAVGYCMTRLLSAEAYDPDFKGQRLKTVYFDTLRFQLRKARLKNDKYFTLRIRCYGATDTYALSAKTKDGKFRKEIPAEVAELYIREGITADTLSHILPGDLLARLIDLTEEEPLIPIVTVRATRYAVEDDRDRITLDTTITTNTGKVFPTNILEQKTTADPPVPMQELLDLRFPPVKLSKFLWSTTYGVR